MPDRADVRGKLLGAAGRELSVNDVNLLRAILASGRYVSPTSPSGRVSTSLSSCPKVRRLEERCLSRATRIPQTVGGRAPDPEPALEPARCVARPARTLSGYGITEGLPPLTSQLRSEEPFFGNPVHSALVTRSTTWRTWSGLG